MPIQFFTPDDLIQLVNGKVLEAQNNLHNLQGTMDRMDYEDWVYMKESGMLKVESMLTTANNLINQARANMEIAKDIRKMKGG
jgi:hypothetical protein